MKKGKYSIATVSGVEERNGWIAEVEGLSIGLCKEEDEWVATEVSSGYRVCTAKNRKECLKKVKENADKLKKELQKVEKLVTDNKAEEAEKKVEKKETKKEGHIMAKKNQVTVQMKVSKVTKNTVRFEEVLENEFAAPEIGTIYIPKATLGNLGYKDGKAITLTVEV